MNAVSSIDRPRRSTRVHRPVPGSATQRVVSDQTLCRGNDLSCTMAYQPIVDVVEQRTVAYEALVRGLHNEPASTVLRDAAEDDGENLLEQRCGTLAVEIAATLGILAAGTDLYVNFSPAGATLESSTLTSSIEAAERAGLPLDRLIVEITEHEPFRNPDELRETLAPYRAWAARGHRRLRRGLRRPLHLGGVSARNR